jgi:hypothetical protein
MPFQPPGRRQGRGLAEGYASPTRLRYARSLVQVTQTMAPFGGRLRPPDAVPARPPLQEAHPVAASAGKRGWDPFPPPGAPCSRQSGQQGKADRDRVLEAARAKAASLDGHTLLSVVPISIALRSSTANRGVFGGRARDGDCSPPPGAKTSFLVRFIRIAACGKAQLSAVFDGVLASLLGISACAHGCFGWRSQR